MSLQSQLQDMCDRLHAVMPYDHDNGPSAYRVICQDGVNRIRPTTAYGLCLRWIGRTPPARISMDFHEKEFDVYSSNPIFRLTGDVIDCGFSADNFYGATWFRMVNLDLRTYGGNIRALKWAKISHLGTNADAIGFYVPPFYGH